MYTPLRVYYYVYALEGLLLMYTPLRVYYYVYALEGLLLCIHP